MESIAVFVALGVIINASIWGLITRAISKSKGYKGGFAWGFWLGIIGLIVVACKPDNRGYNQLSSENKDKSKTKETIS